MAEPDDRTGAFREMALCKLLTPLASETWCQSRIRAIKGPDDAKNSDTLTNASACIGICTWCWSSRYRGSKSRLARSNLSLRSLFCLVTQQHAQLPTYPLNRLEYRNCAGERSGSYNSTSSS